MVPAAVRVGVVDSGWRADAWDHRVRAGYTFFSATAPFVPSMSAGAPDAIGHGTDCTRLILAIAPRVEVVPLRIFGRALETSPAVLCSALVWAEAENFDVLNLSVTTVRSDARNQLYRACERLRRRGTIVVAASRNRTGGGYPAVFDNVIGVNLGAGGHGVPVLREPDDVSGEIADLVVARGWSGPPLTSGTYPRLESTSYATAFVAGCVAQVIGREGRLPLDAVRECVASLVDG